MSDNDTSSRFTPGNPANNGDVGIKAHIGHAVVIHGDLSGKEDLIINGTVEGAVDFLENMIVIGKKGKVNANVTARSIVVEGEVKGELRGSEQVIIKPTGRVFGDIRAPRVTLNDGCQFKGLVDMEEKPHGPGLKPGAKAATAQPFPKRPMASAEPKPSLSRRKR